MLFVDKITASNIFQGEYKHLDLDGVLYVGGMPEESYQFFRVAGTKNFRGCLKDVMYGNINMLSGAITGLNGFVIHGEILFKCRSAANRIISSSSPNVSVRMPYRAIEKYFFTASFQFRTYVKEGLFISLITSKMRLYLLLSNSVLVFEVLDVNGFKTELRLGFNLDDGEWHQLSARLTCSEILLELDGKVTTKTVNNTLLTISRSTNKHRPKIFFGKENKMDTKVLGFVGCILDLKIQGREITISDLRKNRNVQRAVMKSCHLQNRCEPNPCNNRGQCWQDWKQFYCNCDHTHFEGKICEISVYKPTCEHYRSMGLQTNALCLLDSKGEGSPYTALCNATNSPRTYTIITHNEMTETSVGNGKLSGAFYKHEITYTGSAGMDQIQALIQKSKHCRQYIRFHCFASKLLNTPRGPSHAFWLSRDNVRQEYWGGAEPGSNKCACGMTEPPSCAGIKFCNCDVRDRIWRVDAGYLRDKNTLPVTGLLFNKKSKKSEFTLGPLECWGSEDDRESDRESAQSIGENHKGKQTDHRLMRACPSVTKSEKQFAKATLQSPQFTSTTSQPSPESLESMSSVATNASQNFSTLSENRATVLETVKDGNFSQNSSKQANETKTRAGPDEKEEAAGLSTMTVIVISGALIIVISLLIVFDRINRKYKSPFPCKYIGALKIHVAD